MSTSAATYTPPALTVYEDWDGRKRPDFVPNERQLTVINAVQKALDDRLFYTDDVRKFCAKLLNVSPDQAAAGTDRTTGGNFGMDLYYARDFLSVQCELKKERDARRNLNPRVGIPLGTLVFGDKRVTGAKIVEILPDPDCVRVEGKRGSLPYSYVCSALQVKHGMDRAMQRGLRKSDFDQFTESMEELDQAAMPQ